MRSILHLDMDQFYAAVEIRDRPELAGKPVIIGADPESGKGRGVVSTASYEARRFGVHSAMPITKAWRLCPQGVYLRGDMDKYAAVSEEIFAVFESVTPLVEGLSLDEAFLDVTASRLLFGDGQAVALRLKREIWEKVRLKCSVGLSSNKSVSKIASDLRKPDALVVVPPGEEASFLAPLPLKRLWGVGPKAEAELASLGLASIGDLQAYPPEALKDRFGAQAQDLLDLAWGRDDRPVVPEHEAKSLGRECTFGEDTREASHLRQTVAGLCEDLARRLRRHGRRAGQLTLKLRWSGFETHTRQRPLDPPSAHGPDLFQAGQAMLESVLKADRRAVRLVGVQAGKLEAQGASLQESMFSHSSLRKERLDGALDALNDKYGEGALQRANQRRGRSEGL